MLPQPIADRLRQKQEIIADSFADVTVLFADIVGFTKLSEPISPEELVAWLNIVFSLFDDLAEQHGLEKIKTIGDSYMVVGGVPTPCVDHHQAVAKLALDMQRTWVEKVSDTLQLRIGIHSGPVVAGVIGYKKFSYDLWGDTVNMASRMEAHGLPGEIQITETVYDHLKNQFLCEPRGEIQIKGKGSLDVYLLKGWRPLGR